MRSARQFSRRFRSLIAVSGLAVAFGFTVRSVDSAPGAQAPGSVDEKTAAQVFKNIQMLKEMPASQLNRAMDFMSASLGVACDFCHTSAMESDEKSTKLTTRKMIAMTADINKQWFSGFSVVNCYTCHRGRTEPGSSLDLSNLISGFSEGSTASTGELPAAEQVIARYESALGSGAAIASVSTGVMIGDMTLHGPGSAKTTAAVEMYNKAPDKVMYNVSLPGGPVSRGFDGKSGWVSQGNQVLPLERDELSRIQSYAGLLQYLNLKQNFSGFRVLSREKLEGRDVIVAGAAARDGSRIKLYFDAASGLLVRRAGQIRTPFGVLPDITDFENYRRVSGIAFPFRIKRLRPPTLEVFDFREVKINVPIDDSRFIAPQR